MKKKTPITKRAITKAFLAWFDDATHNPRTYKGARAAWKGRPNTEKAESATASLFKFMAK